MRDKYCFDFLLCHTAARHILPAQLGFGPPKNVESQIACKHLAGSRLFGDQAQCDLRCVEGAVALPCVELGDCFSR